jgi:hypothetical protein
MYEIIKVRGVKYPKNDPRYPKHPHQPAGPLFPDPRYPSVAQEYIGWKRVQYPMIEVPHPDEAKAKAGVKIEIPDIPRDELGRVFMGMDAVKEGDGIRMLRNPISFYWKYDSTPIAVEKNPHVQRALERGEIELATEKKGGGK